MELRGNSSTSKHDPHRIGEATSLPLNQPVKESSRHGVSHGFKESCTVDITNGSHSTQEPIALNRSDCLELCCSLFDSYDKYPDSLEEEVMPTKISISQSFMEGGQGVNTRQVCLLFHPLLLTREPHSAKDV